MGRERLKGSNGFQRRRCIDDTNDMRVAKTAAGRQACETVLRRQPAYSKRSYTREIITIFDQSPILASSGAYLRA